MVTIGFLHTSDVHPADFRARLARLAPALTDHHLVDASLLAAARAGLPYRDRLRARLDELAAAGAEVIVCTCSTIGGAAEQLAPPGTRVLRVDRPMAEEAARYRRIGLLHAVESTLAPTRELLAEVGVAADRVLELACPGAWELFEAGETAAYHAAIADRVRATGGAVDVIVLAQASMAPAVALLGAAAVPVLASPEPAVRRAVALAVGPR
ncbi:arylsulfatase [Kitasatospora sp. LaBMicrA B282]|uniref:arylsulfatase n=1 Tax=Kitasatospora sp. LaBMicrA B282 TaxID=3420949 RepID=UPI003D0E1350